MCGIAGFQGSFDRGLLDALSAAIAHRGPDAAGTWFNAAAPAGPVGLAHRRLAIIDLSPAGSQPMWDVARRAAIVFNGEIYNYRELRGELAAGGAVFQNSTDTEVLLQLYLRDGVAMLARLNGIFAFAIFDSRDGSLFLARDGFGVKPLFTAETSKGFVFASELKALLKEPSLPRDLDLTAVHHTVTYLSAPAPRTILKAVKKLPPGEALLVKNGRIQKTWTHYDQPYGQPIADLKPAEAARQVREAIRTAVERQMVADVPVGAFLSGGLDSSAIVAFARGFVRDGARMPCFTIGYPEPGNSIDGMTPDLSYARQVAKHLDVELHEVTIAPDMADGLRRMVAQVDEPLPDPAAINVLLISQLAREHGIKVLLSGTGGDDIFAGYRRHYALAMEKTWRWLPESGRRGLKRAARLAPAATALGRRVAKAFQYAELSGDARIASYFHWIEPAWQMSLYGEALRAAAAAEAFSAPLVGSLQRIGADVPALNRMLYLDVRHFLSDYSLAYTDNMSMAAGVEVRVPLLDPDLVALAARLPVGFKQKGRVGKWIFKKAMEGLLPPAILRRPKTGFGAPIRAWIKGPLAPLVDEVLAEGVVRDRGLFDPAGVRRLIEADRAGQVDAAYPILALICLELWCRNLG